MFMLSVVIWNVLPKIEEMYLNLISMFVLLRNMLKSNSFIVLDMKYLVLVINSVKPMTENYPFRYRSICAYLYFLSSKIAILHKQGDFIEKYIVSGYMIFGFVFDWNRNSFIVWHFDSYTIGIEIGKDHERNWVKGLTPGNTSLCINFLIEVETLNVKFILL